ncbi:Phage integrase family protein [Cupriavidus necator]|uniref:site-specific integrase n=1 Tax=Cupriavidus necator TaxID=106590 RepID=UPI003F734084
MYSITKSEENRHAITRTRGGALFDPNELIWQIREGTGSASLNFSRLAGAVAPEFFHGFQKTLIWYAENKSLRHLDNMFQRAEHLFKFLNNDLARTLVEISEVDLLNYHSNLKENKWYLSSLAGFLKKWNALGYKGISSRAVSLLGELRLQGNKKGVAVSTMDPHDGPFTDIELESIQSALNNAYAVGSIGKAEYLLAWLFMLLGQRPSQYALLKVLDVHAPKIKDGSRIYSIMMPRGKQRKPTRLEFKERLLTPQIGELVYRYALEVEQDFVGIVADPKQAPLFPSNDSNMNPPGMDYHQTAAYVSVKLIGIFRKLKVHSERTGELVHITPTRFRRTLGTRAAREGHGELIIAELLDHSDTQNVGVYVQSTPEIAERIDKAVAMAMAPMAQAFAGVIVRDTSEASRIDPASRIFDPGIEPTCKPMGNCGSHGFCGFSAPIACYTCHSFQAWADGPHEAVLEHLLADRERKLATADIRIAKINDRTILAVAEVIRQCEAANKNIESTDHD